jgi:hypothetical protein
MVFKHREINGFFQLKKSAESINKNILSRLLGRRA